MAKSKSRYTNKLLEQCKSWDGPFINTEELVDIFKSKPDVTKQIVRVELSYCRDIHTDVIANPQLFKLNKVSHQERPTNNTAKWESLHDLACNSSSSHVFSYLHQIGNEENKVVLKVNEICVVLMLGEKNKTV